MVFANITVFILFSKSWSPNFGDKMFPSGGTRGGGAVRRAPGALPQGGSSEGKPFVVVEGDYVLAAHH